MASKKTQIIEHIFRKLWDPATNSLSQTIVTMEMVQKAMHAFPGLGLSDKNPANFFKDFIRSAGRNKLFPPFILEHGYTARQAIGKAKGACFEFVKLASGVYRAFDVLSPPEELQAKPHPIESISMPMAARLLGRSDETWLAQVVARLNVLATHFAINSKRKSLQFDLLQIGVKLGGAEVDALFLLVQQEESAVTESLISAEMKGRRDEIEEEQIVRGANAVIAKTKKPTIPVAVKVIGKSLIYVLEFEQLHDPHPIGLPLVIASQAVYQVIPHMPGIE